jgi:hypothetical protein
MTIRITAAAAAGAVCALLLAAAPATAQTQPQTGGAQPAQPQSHQIRLTEEKIDAFVGAALAVTQVRASWKPKVDAAKSEAEAQQLRDAATAEIKQAVADAPGITTREYIAIARAAQQNPQLGDAIKARFRERQGQQQPQTQ